MLQGLVERLLPPLMPLLRKLGILVTLMPRGASELLELCEIEYLKEQLLFITIKY
jgi:hypothetical protein